MSNEPKWIDDTESLVRELQRLGSDGFSVDTEADSMHHFQEKVCLIQISNPGVDLLIDPLAEIDLEMLGALLADPTSRKILHGADYDVRMLQRDFSFEIRGLYDTMIAARLAGESAFGLAALLDKYIGVKLDKQFQRADWSIRPLSGPMLQYASSDTHYLEELRQSSTANSNRWAVSIGPRKSSSDWNRCARALRCRLKKLTVGSRAWGGSTVVLSPYCGNW